MRRRQDEAQPAGASSNRLTALVGATTRWLQGVAGPTPIPGLWRLHLLLGRWLPRHAGFVTLANGLRIHLDSAGGGIERWIFFAGMHHSKLVEEATRFLEPGAWCVDVGAHVGYLTLAFASRVGPQGRVFSFEPNQELAVRLERSLALNGMGQVEVVQKAVDDGPGRVQLYVSRRMGSGSSSLHREQMLGEAEARAVDAVSLDAFFSERSVPRLDVVKVDIEGHDCQAVLGARNAIAKHRPFVVFEHKWFAPRGALEEVLELLEGLGYDVKLLTEEDRVVDFDWALVEALEPECDLDVLCYPPRPRSSAGGEAPPGK